MKDTCKCFGCKQEFRKEELVKYFSFSGKTSNWYCPKCLEEKQSRERFSDKACQIFGIKSPGPRIWAERKRLMNTYGYTDDIIIDCLDYIYNVQHVRKLSESLCLITPTNVEKMMKYKKEQEYQQNVIAETAAKQNIKVIFSRETENVGRKKEKLNPDDFLYDG